MARRKHEPPEPANDAGSPVFATEADAERYIVDCVQKLQDTRPLGDRGKSVTRAAIERKIAVEHAHIGPDSLDRYLVNLLSDGRLGVTAGRWWVRRKAPPLLVLGLLVLLNGCGREFSAMDGVGGASAGAPPVASGGATLASAGAPSTGVRWPACLDAGCGASCRTIVGPGWCSVMASCLADNGCVASNQPKCEGCSALPDGIDCECTQ